MRVLLAYLPMPGWVLCVAVDASFGRMVFGDVTGAVYQAELIGLPRGE